MKKIPKLFILFCFLTFFSSLLNGQIVNTVLFDEGRIVTIRPGPDKYAVISINNNIGKISVYDEKNKLIVNFIDGDSRFRGDLVNPAYDYVNPLIYFSFNGRYMTFNTWSKNDTRNIPFIGLGSEEVKYYQEILKYDFQKMELKKIIGIGDSVQVIAPQFRNFKNDGIVYEISPVFPGENGDYIRMSIKNGTSIVVAGLFRIINGVIFQLISELIFNDRERVEQHSAPIEIGNTLYYASIEKNEIIAIENGEKQTVLSSSDVFNGQRFGAGLRLIPDYTTEKLYIFSLASGSLVGKDKILVYQNKRLELRPIPTIDNGLVFYTTRLTNWDNININKNTAVNVHIGNLPYQVINENTILNGLPIGTTIGDRVASMGCSVLAIKKDHINIGNNIKDIMFEIKPAVLTSGRAVGDRLELFGCFPEATRNNGVRIIANKGLSIIPEYDDREVTENKISFKIPANVGGETSFEVEIFGTKVPPQKTVNSIKINIPVIPLEFNLLNYFLEVRPNEEFAIQWNSNILGKIFVQSNDISNPVRVMSDLDSLSGEMKLKLIKHTNFFIEFTAINGSKMVLEMQVKVLAPQINTITSENNSEENKIHQGDRVFLQGNNLSYDGEEHINIDENGNLQELSSVGTRVSIDGKLAKIFFISEALIIFEISEVGIGEKWVEVFVNGQGTAYPINISENNEVEKMKNSSFDLIKRFLKNKKVVLKLE